MSTNKTQNYNLHSWVPQDEFHVAEINENFAALDAALEALQGWATTACVAGSAVITNRKATTSVDLGFRPKLLIYFFCGKDYNIGRVCINGMVLGAFRSVNSMATLGLGTSDIVTETGFQFYEPSMVAADDENNVPIRYVAFR